MILDNKVGNESENNKLTILKQIGQIAGPEGYVLIVNWNAENFGEALQHFYNKITRIVGELKKGKYDFMNCTFTQPENEYTAKWFTLGETEGMIYRSE